MFYDLNVPWTTNSVELQQRIDFLAELGYNLVALSTAIPHPVPADLTSPIPTVLPITKPSRIRRILTRVTVPLIDPTKNPRIQDIRPHYDILAVRPVDERTLQQACVTVDCDLISLDLGLRHAYPFRHRTFAAALARGIKFELCYTSGVGDGKDPEARKNVWQNAANIVRATRGRGIVVTSGAESAIGCRGPWDVVNLAVLWGLKQDIAKEAVSEAARSVVAAAQLKSRSFRGVVDVVVGGRKRKKEDTVSAAQQANKKDVEVESEKSSTKVVPKKRKPDGSNDIETPTKPPEKKAKKQNGIHKVGEHDESKAPETKESPKKGKAAREAQVAENITKFAERMTEVEAAAREGREPADDAKLKTTPGKTPKKSGKGKKKAA